MEALEAACLTQLTDHPIEELDAGGHRPRFIDTMGELALNHPTICIQGDWPLRCWRLALYKPIEQLRKLARLRDQPSKSQWALARLLQIIDEGLGLYWGVIRAVCDRYEILDFNPLFLKLGLPLARAKTQTLPTSGPLLDAIGRLLYHFFIATGDLARYKVQYNQVFGRIDQLRMARTMYMQARLCQADQGHPHNMLALLDSQQGKPLDALYRYLRSFTCPHPAPLGRDNLKTFLRQVLAQDKELKLAGLFKNVQSYLLEAQLCDEELMEVEEEQDPKVLLKVLLILLALEKADLFRNDQITNETAEGRLILLILGWRKGQIPSEISGLDDLLNDLVGFTPLQDLLRQLNHQLPSSFCQQPTQDQEENGEEEDEDEVVLFKGIKN